jgi:hypothetical protein
MQGIGQQADGGRVGPAAQPSLQIADRAVAQVGALGQVLLRQASG